MLREKKKIKSKCDFNDLKNNKCEDCKKIWLKPINWLIKKFAIVYQFCNGGISKFVLLLRKGVSILIHGDLGKI